MTSVHRKKFRGKKHALGEDMKRFFCLISLFAIGALVSATPTKRELGQERDALKADMIAAGVYERVISSSHPLQEPMPPELQDRLLQLVDNYRAWVHATFPIELDRVNIIHPESEPNDTLGTADKYTDNHAFSGDAPPGDLDFFSYNITSTANDLVIFNHMPQTGNSTTDDSEMYVYLPDGTPAFSSSGGGPYGTARVAFFPNGITGEWKFSLAKGTTGGTSATVPMGPYNVYALEIPMAPTGNVLVNAGDTFTHTFDAMADDTVHVAVFVDADPAVTEYDIDLYLYDPNSVLLDGAETTAINFELLPYEHMPVTGTYTVEVYNYALTGTPQQYEFGVYVSALKVPTLSTWGIVFFTCLLAGAGLFFVRRKRTA